MASYDHQDWKPVVFHVRAADPKAKQTIAQAQRKGAGIETLSKDRGREARDAARKLEADLCDPGAGCEAPKLAALPKLSGDMRKALTEARTKAGLTRDQLAQRLNVKPKVVVDLETGAVVNERDVLAKINRILGTHLKFA